MADYRRFFSRRNLRETGRHQVASSSGPRTDLSPTKSCRICGHQIPKAAIKCTKCDSFQNWFGKIHLSTTTLSLLVALIASSVSAIPVLRDLFSRDDSRIYVKLGGVSEEGITLLAVNSGTRPGLVSEGIVQESGRAFGLLRLQGAQHRLVNPGRVEALQYKLRVFRDRRERSGSRDCEASIHVVNFRSNESYTILPMTCRFLTAVLEIQSQLHEHAVPAEPRRARPAAPTENSQ